MRTPQPIPDLQVRGVVHGSTPTHRGVQREAAVVPAAHVAGVVGIERTDAGEPAQYPPVELLGDGGDLLGCECLVGVSESDLVVFAGLEQAVDCMGKSRPDSPSDRALRSTLSSGTLLPISHRKPTHQGITSTSSLSRQ